MTDRAPPRRRTNPFKWFLVGFLVGTAVTIGVFVYVRYHPRAVSAADEPGVKMVAPAPSTDSQPNLAGPPSIQNAPPLNALPPATAAAAPPATAAPPPATPGASDTSPPSPTTAPPRREPTQQVFDDAAAAGMTSARPPKPPTPAPAKAPSTTASPGGAITPSLDQNGQPATN